MGRPAVAPVKPAAPRPPASGVKVAPGARLAPGSDKTTREIIPPWHVLQEKLQKKADARDLVPADEAARQALAAQEAANEQWMPKSQLDVTDSQPPSSGVRVSDAGQPSAAVAEESTDEANLSFKVYTLAELERRSDAPVSVRMSRANLDNAAARGSASVRWMRVYTALRAFLVASIAWWKTQGERPSVKVALRKPFDVLGDELQVAVEATDWKKYGVTTGIVVGASLTLLFAVLTAAELTDDLKPPAHLASSEPSSPSTRTAPDLRGVAPATQMAALGVQPVITAPAPAVQPVTSVGEIDEEPAAAPPQTARRPARKNTKPAKSGKLGYRNADAIFNP